MRITGSPFTKEYRAQGRFGSGFFKSTDRKSLGLNLMTVSAALGLVLLIWMGAYARTWQSVLPRLRGWLDRVPTHTNGLATLHLNLEMDAYQALAMQRQQALRTGILLPAAVHWVPAKAGFQGHTTPVRVRLAGSEPEDSVPASAPSMDHWTANKWSLEVEGDGAINGMRTFALSSPAMRGYLNGWLYLESLRRAGIPAPGCSLVNLVLNGEDWGIYAMEEWPHADASTLEAELRGRLLAHADLWGARLPDSEHPPQFLADPAVPLAGSAPGDDPALAAAYAREAARISQPHYLVALEKIHRREFQRYHNALASEFFSAYLQAPWDALAERQRMLSSASQSQELVRDAPSSPDITLDVASPLPAMNLPPDVVYPPAPSLEEALARHPFLQPTRTAGTQPDRQTVFLQVAPGTWHVEGDLVLPEGVGLQASQAFTLCFERDAILLARGPLALHGPERESIRLLPAEDRWGGIFVQGTGAGEGSSLDNVEIRGARGIQRDGWQTGAGITFVDMPVRCHRCRVLDSDAPTAVSIVGAPFEWVHSELGIASGDLLSVENAAGHIEHCAFHDTLGSAIHVSKSRVDVHDVSLLRVGEVPLLADEGSRIREQAIRTVDVGLSPGADTSPEMHPLHVRFGPFIRLVGYELTTPERAPGETVEVILYWRAFASLNRPYTVFVHLLNDSGEWVTGWDMMPRYNLFPTTDWPVAELIDDVRILPLPSDLPPGTYTVAVGMYEWGTGERLPAFTREGTAIPNQAVMLEDRVTVK